MDNKQSIYKLQNDVFKGAFGTSIFPEESAGSSMDFIVIGSIGKAMVSKSLSWINEQPTLLDNFFADLFVVKKEEMITTLINGYFYIQHELTKQSNLIHPKLKEFLERLFSFASNYTKLVFTEEDYVMGYIEEFDGTFPEFLGTSVYKYTINEGFPTTLLLEIRSDVPNEIYSGMMSTFYLQVFNTLSNVTFFLCQAVMKQPPMVQLAILNESLKAPENINLIRSLPQLPW